MARAIGLAIAALTAGCDCYTAHEGADTCTPGARCVGDVHERCGDDGVLARRDCAAEGLRCEDARGCIACDPGEVRCAEANIERCADDGSGWLVQGECDLGVGELCEAGECLPACDAAARAGSTSGCDFWAVDLPIGTTAGFDVEPLQVVVTSELPATVSVEVRVFDVETRTEEVVERADVPSGDLHAFELERRPVRGPDGSAISSAAYRIVSSLPVRATQIGGERGVGPPSPDGSLLLPTAALGERTVVLSWPQTIGAPDFDPGYPSYVTVVGTTEGTTVTVTPADTIAPTGGFDGRVNVPFEVSLGPYEVLHLETNEAHADLTGTVVESTAPVAIFAGSEASDVPAWDSIGERQCCAGHLEEQIPPVDRLGTDYVVPLAPSRSVAVSNAGAEVAVVREPTYVRVMATAAGRTTIETTLPEPWDAFDLPERGFETIELVADFRLQSSAPVAVAILAASQQATGIPSLLPGGAPTFALVPPVERFVRRAAIVVPNGMPFDFVTILGADDVPAWDDVGIGMDCEFATVGPDLVVQRCQVSFPEILEHEPDPVTGAAPWIQSVSQADGVHVLESDAPFGVLVAGFGSNAAYAMPGL